MGTIGLRTLTCIAAVLAIALGGGSVLADTDLRTAGSVGPHRLRDGTDDPGAWCGYRKGDEGFDRVLIRVRPPIIRARDAMPGRDSQLVGWRATLVLGPGATYPADAITTPIQTAIAWEDTPAAFTPLLIPTNGLDTIIVKVRMVWYGRDGTTLEGWSRHRVDHYLITVWGGSIWEDCPGWGFLG